MSKLAAHGIIGILREIIDAIRHIFVIGTSLRERQKEIVSMNQKTSRLGMKLVSLVVLFAFCLAVVGCGCDEENPTVALANNGTAKADIQIKTSGGNTENMNNIQPGSVTERRSFAPGDIEFTIGIQGVDEPIVYVLRASYCNEYDVKISEDNSVSSSSREVD